MDQICAHFPYEQANWGFYNEHLCKIADTNLEAEYLNIMRSSQAASKTVFFLLQTIAK